MPLTPFKKPKSAKPVMSKRDPMPNRVSGARKTNRPGGQSRDPFDKTVTNMAPRHVNRVKGK